MFLRPLTTTAGVELPSLLAVWPKLPAKILFILREPNRSTSTGDPSTKAAFMVPPLVPIKLLFVVLLGEPASSPAAFTLLEFFNCSIVLRDRSLPLNNSSRVFPFLFWMLLTKPWILSMSWTCKLIYFWSTEISLSISILRLWRPVSILLSS